MPFLSGCGEPGSWILSSVTFGSLESVRMGWINYRPWKAHKTALLRGSAPVTELASVTTCPVIPFSAFH